MTLDELEALCAEAARDLAARNARPLPAAVVLPGEGATAVATLPDFPDDDIERFDFLSRFAADRVVPAGTPCYGFIAEGSLDAGEGRSDVLVVVYGARRHRPRVMAAPLPPEEAETSAAVEVGPFSAAEPLDPTAMSFLSPLQHAVDAVDPPDVTGSSVLDLAPEDHPSGEAPWGAGR